MQNEVDMEVVVAILIQWPFLFSGSVFVYPLNAELNPICHLLELLGAHRILHVSRIRVKLSLFSKSQKI